MSFIDDCVQFLEDLILGDFNEQQMVSAQLIGGLVSLIPVMDQVMDARDVSGCLYRINKRGGFAKATLEEKVDFGFAAFGVVPEMGSAVKTVFKPLYKQRKRAKGMINGGVAMIERMLGHKKGGAVRWVRTLDWAGKTQMAIVQANAALESCIAMLDYLGQSHWWVPDRLERLARDVSPGLKAMRGKLAAPIREAAAEIKKFLEEMLGEHAAAVAMSVASGTTGRQRSHAAVGSHAGGRGRRQAHKPVAEAPRTQVRKTKGAVSNTVQATAYQLYAPLNFALKGLLGEHIVEHHVIERKGWGLEWNRHDMAGGAAGKASGWQNQYRKINDNEIPLYLCTPSKHVLQSGIDSAWFTNRPRPYQFAIVEAKASMNPNAKLIDLLGEANDNSAPQERKASRPRGGRTPAGSKPAGTGKKKVLQMSYPWIEQRLSNNLPRWRERVTANFSRHVFLVTPLQATGHIRAVEQIVEGNLIGNPAGAQQFAHLHAEHDTQREFDESELLQAERTYASTGKPKRRTGKKK